MRKSGKTISDGSVEIQNAGVTQRLEKGGNFSITNTGDLSTDTDGDELYI